MTGSCFGLAWVGLVRRWHKPSCAPTRSRVSAVMRLPVRVPARRVPHGQMYAWGCELHVDIALTMPRDPTDALT